ncbi:hypothetical protein BGZ52_007434 [Haplosporangium bisporale]|nr:hypothetical protein BGZ52_007434 [Haplosporangium bisporale]
MTHLRELDLAGETIRIRVVEDMSFAKDLVSATLTVSRRASASIDSGKENKEDTETIDARGYEWVRKQAQLGWRYNCRMANAGEYLFTLKIIVIEERVTSPNRLYL